MQSSQTIKAIPYAVDRLMQRKRLISILLPLAVIAYLVVVYFALGIPGQLSKRRSGRTGRS